MVAVLIAVPGCGSRYNRDKLDAGGWYKVKTIYIATESEAGGPQRSIVFRDKIPTLDPRWYSPPAIDTDGDPKGYGTPFYLTAQDISDSDAAVAAKMARNNLQAAMFGVSEQAYDDHMSQVFATQDVTNLALGWTALGLTTAGAAGGAPQLMSALATGFIGARSQLNEEVYAKQFAQTISNAIKEDRTLFKRRIYERHDKEIVDYPVEAAIDDAKEFHRRGSFLHGLELLLEAAQEQANEKSKKSANLLTDKPEDGVDAGRTQPISPVTIEDVPAGN